MNIFDNNKLKFNEEYFNTDHLKANLRYKAVKGGGITVLTRITNYVISTVATIILSRILTPYDFGLVTMVMTFSLLLRNFGINGFPEAIIQEEKLSHEQVSNLFWIHLFISICLAIFFIALSPVIIWFYNEPRLSPIIYAMAVTIIIPCFSTHHMALIRRNMEFTKLAGNEFLATFVSSVVGIIFALLGFGYWAIVARRVAIPFSSSVGAWFVCSWRPGLPKKGVNVNSMIKYALNTYGNFVTYYLTKNMDKILIGKFFGPQPLANYDRASNLFVAPVNQLTSPLSNVALPVLSRLLDDHERYTRYFLKTLSLLSFIGMLLSSIATIIGNDLILLLLGPQWIEAGLIFSIFGASIGMMLLYDTISWLHLSLGTPHRLLHWGIISAIFTICSFIIGLKYGAIGVAVGYSASFYILLLPGLWFAAKPINLKIFKIIDTIWKYFISALLTVFICWLFINKIYFTSSLIVNYNIFLRIIVSCFFCTLFYLMFTIILHRSFAPIGQFISLLYDMASKFKK